VPSEYRQVLFSNNEVIEALYEHNRVAVSKLPKGIIVSCTPVAEVDVAVRLELADQESGETHVASLSPELVCAALLRYCMKLHIPMPKSAAKSIQIHGDDVALIVRIHGRTGK
jgi:hypothetical protein